MNIIREIRDRKLPRGLATIYENINIGKVLDLGCGDGREIEFLQEKGFECMGIDWNTEKIGQNKERNSSVNWISQDIRNFKFEQQYELIIAKTVIHYFPKEEQIELIKKIKNATKDNGINFIATFTDEIPMKGQCYLMKKNELLNYYLNWKILQFAQRVTPIHTEPGNPEPHQHSVSILIASQAAPQ